MAGRSFDLQQFDLKTCYFPNLPTESPDVERQEINWHGENGNGIEDRTVWVYKKTRAASVVTSHPSSQKIHPIFITNPQSLEQLGLSNLDEFRTGKKTVALIKTVVPIKDRDQYRAFVRLQLGEGISDENKQVVVALITAIPALAKWTLEYRTAEGFKGPYVYSGAHYKLLEGLLNGQPIMLFPHLNMMASLTSVLPTKRVGAWMSDGGTPQRSHYSNSGNLESKTEVVRREVLETKNETKAVPVQISSQFVRSELRYEDSVRNYLDVAPKSFLSDYCMGISSIEEFLAGKPLRAKFGSLVVISSNDNKYEGFVRLEMLEPGHNVKLNGNRVLSRKTYYFCWDTSKITCTFQAPKEAPIKVNIRNFSEILVGKRTFIPKYCRLEFDLKLFLKMDYPFGAPQVDGNDYILPLKIVNYTNPTAELNDYKLRISYDRNEWSLVSQPECKEAVKEKVPVERLGELLGWGRGEWIRAPDSIPFGTRFLHMRLSQKMTLGSPDPKGLSFYGNIYSDSEEAKDS